MKNLRQAMAGILVALLSVGLIIGGLAAALMEGQTQLALIPTFTRTPAPTRIRLTPTPYLDATGNVIQPATELPTEIPPETLPAITDQAPIALSCDRTPANWLEIRVQPGDELSTLAQAYGTTVEEIKLSNCLVVDTLLPDTRLFVPPPPTPTSAPSCVVPAGWVPYLVQPGDTLSALSLRFGTSIARLKEVNCIASYTIYAYTTIYVPYVPQVRTPTPVPTHTPRPSDTLEPSTTPSATNPPQPSDSPTPTVTTEIAPSDTPTATPTPSATNTPTDSPLHTPTSTPTATATPTSTPTATETVTTSPTPTDTPTNPPTDTATSPPTFLPTDTPTSLPTSAPKKTSTLAGTSSAQSTPNPTP